MNDEEADDCFTGDCIFHSCAGETLIRTHKGFDLYAHSDFSSNGMMKCLNQQVYIKSSSQADQYKGDLSLEFPEVFSFRRKLLSRREGN